MSTEETFTKLKELVHQVAPDAKVLLFGSRANNSATDDSDWDLLVIDKQPVDRVTKKALQDVLYPFSLKILSLIHFVLVSEEDWKNNPRYGSLKLSVSKNPVME